MKLKHTCNSILYLLCLCVLLIAGNTVLAQERSDMHNREWSAEAAVFMVKAAVADRSFSSSSYKNIIPGFGLAVTTTGQKTAHYLELFYTNGSMSAAADKNAHIQNSYFSAAYTQLYTVFGSSSQPGFVGKIGAGLRSIYASRRYDGFINNNTAFESATGICAALEAKYIFTDALERFTVSGRIGMPVAIYLRQPSFAGEKAGSSGKFTSLGSFLGINDRLSVEMTISALQKISLVYVWDYYQIETARPVKQANHQAGLAYSLKF